MLISRIAAKWLAITTCVLVTFTVSGRVLASDHNAYIPSDTPFYMGTGEGLPIDLILAFTPAGKLPVPDDTDSEDEQYMESVAGMLNNLDKVLPEWGLGETLHFSVYAVGIQPVLRLQLDDAEKFDASLSKLAKEREFKSKIVERTGFKVRVFSGKSTAAEAEKSDMETTSGDTASGSESKPIENPVADANVELLVATNQRDLIVALIPNGSDDDLYDRVLGIKKPDNAMIDSARLDNIRKRWGYGDHFAAFLDLTVVAGILTSAQTDAGRELGALSDGNTAIQSQLETMRSEPCRSEINAIASNWPMLVTGLREFTVNDEELRYTSHFASEIGHERFKQTLQLLRGVIPHSQSASRALMSVGLGLSVDNLTQFIGQMSNQLREMQYECTVLSGLNSLSSTDLSAASMGVVMFGGLARGVEGVSVNIFDVAFSTEDASSPISGADMAVVVNAKDPQVLIQTLQMMPQLGMLAELPLDGSEVSIDSMLPVPVPDGVELKAAIKDKNIVMFAGEKSAEYVGRLANNNQQGLLRMQLDTASLIEKFTSVMQMIGQDSDQLNDAVEFLKEYPNGFVDYSMDFTNEGVELLSSGVVERSAATE